MKDIHPTKLILAVLAPFIAAGSAWLCAAVAKYGIHLDPAGVNALATAGALAAVALAAKLIHDVGAKQPAAQRSPTLLELLSQAAAMAEKKPPDAPPPAPHQQT